jgi:hypothetical protein
VFTNVRIVTDVHMRVEPASASQACGAQCTGIHRSERTNFDVVFEDHTTELRNSKSFAVDPVRPPEPWPTDDGARTDGDAIAKASATVDHGVGCDGAIVSETGSPENDGAGTDINVVAEDDAWFEQCEATAARRWRGRSCAM